MDKPASALDPISTETIESLKLELKKDCTIVIAAHNRQQARRCADYTAYSHLGELVAYDETSELLANPKQRLTQSYISGRLG